MTQLKYFKVIYTILLFTYFVYNYYSIASWINKDEFTVLSSNATVKGIAEDKVEFEILEGEISEGIRKISNIKYINDSPESKTLDLYLPASIYTDRKYPLIIYIHGGAWLEGDKSYFKDTQLVKSDYIVASLDYRLSQEDLFPAQIHDIKAAVRWLRANADKYFIDKDNIGAYGESAGGHLAALLGTTSDNKALNGDIGLFLNKSTYIKAVVSEYGLFDFKTIATECEKSKICKSRYRDKNSIISKLLGCTYNSCDKTLELASPQNYVSSNDSAFLLFHGKKDSIVPYLQTENFNNSLIKAGLESEALISENGLHIDGKEREKYMSRIKAFFDLHLKSQEVKTCDEMPAGQTFFKDIRNEDIDSNVINRLACRHIFYGLVTETFEPDTVLTRAEAGRLIKIAYNIPTDYSCGGFEDLPISDTNYTYITSLKCNNITKGYDENNYKPSQIISTIEFLNMISKAKKASVTNTVKIFQEAHLPGKKELTRRYAALILSLYI